MSGLELLQKEISLVEEKLTDAAASRKKLINSLHSTQRKSAANLIQYLALRNEDVRSLQDDLHQAGLSSMASAESHILKQVQSIRQRLGAKIKEHNISDCTYLTAEHLLNRRATELFGFKKDAGIPHVMVTLDESFEEDVTLLKNCWKPG
jgi:pyruvate kinase